MSQLDVLKSYLTQEIYSLFGYEQDRRTIQGLVERLPKNKKWRLLEALAGAWSLTGVYSELSDTSYNWELKGVSLPEIKLGPMYKSVNPTLEQYNFDTTAVIKEIERDEKILQKFFSDATFLEKLDQMEPVIALQDTGSDNLTLLDGHHRVLARGLKGDFWIDAYVATRYPECSKNKLLPIFPGLFLRGVRLSAKESGREDIQESVDKVFEFLKAKAKYRNFDQFIGNKEVTN